jgi:PAS domain S-box-containing protein
MNQKTAPELPKNAAERMELMQAALRFAGIGLYRYRLDGTLIEADEGTLQILDLAETFPDPAMLKGRNVSELLVYKLPKGHLREQLLQHRHLRDFQYPFRTLSGIDKWALHDSYIVNDPETGEEYAQVVARDITPLKQAEEALAAEKERLLVTLRSIGDGVIATDANGQVVLINKVAEHLTGWAQEQAAGQPLDMIFRIINEETRQPADNPVTRVLKEGVTVGLANHTALVSRDGTERAIADSGAPIFDHESRIVGVVLVFRDVTDLRRLQMDNERADRLESLGQLAGGIAHDFNNILMGVLGSITLARARLPATGNDELAGFLSQAERACGQARALTQQLLTFARGGAPVRKVVSLPELLQETVAFSLHGAAVRADFSLPQDLWHVEADPGQLSQVIGNLVLNARQAMPEGGKIEIQAANVAPGTEPSVPDGRQAYVRVRVRDHGTGISPRHLPHIFDPYFSTKQSGTGLGLSIVHSIVARHNGRITVASILGQGATFDVFLPASDAPLPAVAAETGATVTGQGPVLVMDDEEYVLETTVLMLSMLGYTPVRARNGDEAVTVYTRARAEGRPFRAVILDLTVRGGLGGLKTLERLREADPSVVAIVSSGYSSDPVLADPARYGFRSVLPKPYGVEDIARVLATVIAP